MTDAMMVQVLTEGLTTALSAGGAVWFVLKIKFAAIERDISDAKETAVRAHTRIDALQASMIEH